ncbi:hypothetical protein ACFQ1S_04950 [Kibdelosporangium lantanae]|uniref:Uncharacterized protein n=1 Tax=Kibdelosporangium lantanae TaxID=1497396 RepID=A0ABW3M5W6_9PSEU
MPNLDFYAVDDDWSVVLEAVFDLGLFRVFQSNSEPGQDLPEFHAPTEIPNTFRGRLLSLFAIGSGPEPIVRRADSRPGGRPDTFQYHCEGWGLIQLHHGSPTGPDVLPSSHTNHNSEKRAVSWSAVNPEFGDPAEWDWAAVTSASGKLNRAIRRLAVSKIGSRPVLPHAARFIADADLRYQYGVGIHATPPFGMVRE